MAQHSVHPTPPFGERRGQDGGTAACRDGVRSLCAGTGDPIRFAPGTCVVAVDCSLTSSPRQNGSTMHSSQFRQSGLKITTKILKQVEVFLLSIRNFRER